MTWIIVEDACLLTGYSEGYIRKLAREGKIAAIKVTPRAWLLNRESILKYKRQMEGLGNQRYNPHRRQKEEG